MSSFLFLNNIKLDIVNFNNDFVLLKSKQPANLSLIGETILNNNFDFIDEVIATEQEICLKTNKNFIFSKLAQFNQLIFKSDHQKRTIKIPIYFKEHNDWQTIMEHTSFTKSAIITKLKSLNFSVAMFGFLPGFVYLNGLPNELHVPRKNTPAKYIKANSLAIGGPYLGIYSLPSPGGWNIIGQLACSVINIPNLPPVQINNNDELIITQISESTYHSIIDKEINLMQYNGFS